MIAGARFRARSRAATACLGAVCLLSFVLGCAGGPTGVPFGTPTSTPTSTPSATPGTEPMTQHRLEELFSDEVEAITGPVGALQSEVRGIPVYLFSDVANDRMRLFAALARVESLDPRIYPVLLTANFHSALDARYAVSDGFVFSIFMHPISSLSPELLRSGLDQVVRLVETFGTTYSSSDLAFPSLGASEDSGH